MRTKNPFCTGSQLAVLRAIKLNPKTRVRDMSRTIKMSEATFANTLTKLIDAGHLKRNTVGQYFVLLTGRMLIDCAERIEYARARK